MNNFDKLSRRAEELDRMSQSGISDRLTLEEASNIVNIWGVFLEYSGVIGILFCNNIPESLLPYPKHILVGAINKMAEYYHDQGLSDKVGVLESTLIGLTAYTNDIEAVNESLKQFQNEKWREAFIPGLKRFQRNQMENGYLVDKKLWKFGKSRLEEINEFLEWD